MTKAKPAERRAPVVTWDAPNANRALADRVLLDRALLDRALAVAAGAGAAHLTDVASWHAHVPFVHALIELMRPGLVVELGVHRGDSLLSMAEALRGQNQPGRVIGIDSWRGDDHAGHYDGTAVLQDLMERAAGFGPRVTLLRTTFDAAVAGFADGSIDLLHIDGLHTYDAVRADFDTWRPKLSARGVVMLHDIAVTDGDFGVHRLWAEIRGLGPAHGFGYGNGLGVLALGDEVPAEVCALLQALSAAPGADRMFAALGEAMEGRSLRRILSERLARLQADLEAERHRARDEIARLGGEIAAEREQAGAEIARLGREQAAERGGAVAERARLAEDLREARLLVQTEQARLERELADNRHLAGAEIARLTATLDSGRQAAAAEITRLNDALAEARQAAGAEVTRLTAALAVAEALAAADRQAVAELRAEERRLQDLLAGDREKAGAEIGRLEREQAEARAQAAAERERLTDDLRAARQQVQADRAALEGELADSQRQAGEEIARLAAALDGAERQAEAERQAAEAEAARLAAALDDSRRAGVAEAERLGDALAAARQEALAEAERLSDALAEARQEALAEAERLGDALAAARQEALAEAERLSDALAEARQEAVAEAARLGGALAEAEALVAAERQAAGALAAEEGRLQELIAGERAQAGAEIARLNALVDSDRQAGGAEIERLNREIAGLQRAHFAALDAARLKRRAMRGFKKVAFPAFRALPLPARAKSRLRLAIVQRWGEALQIVPPKTPALATQTQLALRQLSGRYLDLARASTGVPANLPPRSVSIIVPVYNQIEYTLRCIEAIRRNTGDIAHEIIIVDDGSTDMTEIMLSPRSDITYLRNAENLGFIGSCNAGLARAGMEYVCFLNNDTEVTPRWLSALVDTFEMHPGAGLAGAQLIYPDGRLQEAGGIVWDDFSGWNWGRLQDPVDPHFTYARHADYCSGAAVLLPRALARAIGGFDPEFTPAYGEDSDMAFRLRAMGLSTIYQPLSRVVHYEGVTSGTDTTKGVKAYQVVNAEKLKARWAHVLPQQGPNGVNPDAAVERGKLGRILVIDQITPEPDKDAGSITALELMLALRDLGYKVVFVPCSNFAYIPDYTDLLNGLGIESVLGPWTSSLDEHLRRVGDTYAAAVIFRVNTATAHLETVRRLAPSARVIFHNSDLHFLREERARQVDNPNVAERNSSSEVTRRAELAIIGQSDVTVVHSHYEAELLAEFVPGVPVVVFPWVYEQRGAGKPWAERRDIVFLGGYRHYPNVDAVLHYARDIAPLVDQHLHGAVFRAIGSNPTPEMQALAGPRLAIEGFVEDLEPVLASARVMLVPLRYGAGLKGKIVTAMAHGLPIVTTSVGAEGMGLTDGQDVLIADTPEAMTEAIVRLYTNADLWRRLSRAGLEFVARTTSRAAGLRITRSILDHCGLPGLPGAPVAAGAADATYRSAAGTPAALLDAAALADAARRVLGLAAGADLALVLPGAAAAGRLTNTDAPGLRLMTLADLPGRDRAVPMALVVDEFDAAGLAAALAAAGAELQRPGWTLLFLPPRLEATRLGHSLRHSLSGVALAEAEARRPAHLAHAGAVEAACGRAPRWVADCGVLGFAALPFALPG
ncbi:MAG: glycosyltransferase [Paracoccaceae bacterium]